MDYRETFILTKAGQSLSPEQIDLLERRLIDHPSDLETLLKLIGFYSKYRHTHDDSRRGQFFKYCLSVIRYYPETESSVSGHLRCIRVTDGEYYDDARRMWLAHLENAPDNLEILANAISFLQAHDSALALELSKRGEDLEPTNPEWHHRASKALSYSDQHAQALLEQEKATRLAVGTDKWNYLKDLPDLALVAGDSEKAKDYAHTLIDISSEFKELDDFWDVLHSAHMVLAAIAIKNGDAALAKLHVTSSYRGSASDSKTVDWTKKRNISVLQHLLDLNERNCVLDFLLNFQKSCYSGAYLERWISEIRSGVYTDLSDDRPYGKESTDFVSTEQFWQKFCRFVNAPPAKESVQIKTIPLWDAFITLVQNSNTTNSNEAQEALRAVPVARQRELALKYRHAVGYLNQTSGLLPAHIDHDRWRIALYFHKNFPPEILRQVLTVPLEDDAPKRSIVFAIDVLGDNFFCMVNNAIANAEKGEMSEP